MKVLLFMPYTPTPSNGFNSVPYNILQGLIQQKELLEKSGLEILLASDTGQSLAKDHRFGNIEFLSYKSMPPRTFSADLQSFGRIFTRIKLNDINVIHSHDICFTFPAAFLFKGPIIHNFHGLPWKEKSLTNSGFSAFSYEMRTARKRLIKHSKNLSFVCISSYVYKEAKLFLKVSEERLKLIPDPISDDFFNIQKDPEAGLIFYPARLVPRKNHLPLIRALGILKQKGFKDFKLALTGAPEDLQYFNAIKFEIEKSGRWV